MSRPATFIPPDAHLYLIESDGMSGELLRPLMFHSALFDVDIVAPAGFITDFASIPRGLWNIFPKRGKWDRAAVLHDAGYQDKLLTLTGHIITLPKDTIDAIFQEAMEVSGVGFISRHMMHQAVRWFGGHAFKKDRHG